jgi:hypothetical protein
MKRAHEFFCSFNTVEDIPEYYFEKNKVLTGKVIVVHDGDGFRMLHRNDNGILSRLFGENKRNIVKSMSIVHANIINNFISYHLRS